jgi:lipoprotein-anchoring transpeptidase ErfK/SrfK
MKRHLVIVCSLVCSSVIFAPSAFAYYQNQFNPNSRAYHRSNGIYFKSGFKQRVAHAPYQRRTFHYPSEIESKGRSTFIYDPKQLSWAVYDAQGSLLRTGAGSSGSHYCADLGRSCRTPAGTYSVYSKAGPGYRSKIFPKPRGGAPMPYAMFFRGGYAIHGSYSVPNYNASHGCIRVTPADAYWLSKNALSNGSTVIVRSYVN